MTYPVSLDVEGRRCVVLGGGDLAAEKVRGLLDAGAEVTVVCEDAGDALEAVVAEGTVRPQRRRYRSGDLAGAFLAVDATGDDAVNHAAFAEAEASGVLLNVVDRPRLCRFTAPAIVHREPLTLAISTTGESPYLASALRARLERLIGEEWGPFTALVGRIRRRLRERGTPLDQQTTVYRRLLRSDVRRRLREGDLETAQFHAAAIEAAAGSPQPGRVALVGAGPGEPTLITLAATEVLAEADYVFHDALVHPATLALCGPATRLVDVGKRAGRPCPAQADITRQMIELARGGHDIVRLKGGDPFLFGRGGEELAELRQAGLDVVVIPGVSAALAAPAAAGIPVTMRGISTSVAIITGHDRIGATPARLEVLAGAVDTLVVLMPLGNLEAIIDRVTATLGPDRPAAVVSSATLENQAVVRGRIADIVTLAATAGVAAPATLVIGEVVNAVPVDDIIEFDLQARAADLAGSVTQSSATSAPASPIPVAATALPLGDPHPQAAR